MNNLLKIKHHNQCAVLNGDGYGNGSGDGDGSGEES